MKLLVGLGNPGRQYARQRHNVGFMAADAIAEAHGFGPWRRRFQAEVAEGRLGGQTGLMLKPATYMNESGRAVGEAMRFYKLEPSDVIVFHDELDLEPGKVKVKQGGGHAGHNGLRSLDAHIGPDFHRVRIGIGHPGAREMVQPHVLHDFAKAELTWLEPLLAAIAGAAADLVAGKHDRFMNAVATRMQGAAKIVAAEKASPQKAKAAAKQAGTNQVKAPSQRELARAQATRSKAAPKPAEPAKPKSEGVLARLLRRWIGKV